MDGSCAQSETALPTQGLISTRPARVWWLGKYIRTRHTACSIFLAVAAITTQATGDPGRVKRKMDSLSVRVRVSEFAYRLLTASLRMYNRRYYLPMKASLGMFSHVVERFYPWEGNGVPMKKISRQKT